MCQQPRPKRPRPPTTPTASLVGSAERVEVYRRRAAARQPLFVAGDTAERVSLPLGSTRQRSLARNPRSKDPALPPGVMLICGRQRCYRARCRAGKRGSNGVALGYYLTAAEAAEAI